MGELFPNSIPTRQAMAQWLAGIQNFYDFIFIFEMVQPGQHLMKPQSSKPQSAERDAICLTPLKKASIG